MDLVFVLDSSGSVMKTNWQRVLTFTQHLISNFAIHPDSVRVGVVSYGNHATAHIRLTDYDEEMDLSSAIGKIAFKDQWTNTAEGLRVAREKVFELSPRTTQDGARKVIVMVTDGESNRNQGRTLPEAILTRNSGIEVVVLAVGSQANLVEAAEVAGHDENVFVVSNFEKLTKMEFSSSLLNHICGRSF